MKLTIEIPNLEILVFADHVNKYAKMDLKDVLSAGSTKEVLKPCEPVDESEAVYKDSINNCIKVAYTRQYVLELNDKVPEFVIEMLENTGRAKEKYYSILMNLLLDRDDNGRLRKLPFLRLLGEDIIPGISKEVLESYIRIYPNYLDEWKRLYPSAFQMYYDIKPVLDEEIRNKIIYPNQYFRVFRVTDPNSLKVVILGQDPYHNGKATGLAFENESPPYSPSLQNINKLTSKPLGLIHAYQGVLLLNTALTVERGKPLSHRRLWNGFSTELIKLLGKNEDLVWILLGSHAHSYANYIRGHILKASHPSPMSASKDGPDYPAFLKSDIFNKANDILISKGHCKIHF